MSSSKTWKSSALWLAALSADLLIAEPDKVTKPVAGKAKAAGGGSAGVVPLRRDGRSLPPG
jgi:hypothetical protein